MPYKYPFDKHTLDNLTTKEYILYILVRRVRIRLPCYFNQICKFNYYHYLVRVDLEIRGTSEES